MLGDYRITEPLVETLVSGQLSTNANPHRLIALGSSVVLDPDHQGRPDALSLVGGINPNPADVQVAVIAIEPQTANRPSVHQRQRAA
jgi:hypothetical protein